MTTNHLSFLIPMLQLDALTLTPCARGSQFMSKQNHHRCILLYNDFNSRQELSELIVSLTNVPKNKPIVLMDLGSNFSQ